jgi:low temperature requirement protein LtrA
MARDVFSVMHFPMLCGVIGVAAAIEAGLAHPDQVFAPGLRIALGVGAALFVCGTAAALWRAGGRPLLGRFLLMPAAAVAVVAVGAVPWVAMALVAASLAAVSATEHRLTA